MEPYISDVTVFFEFIGAVIIVISVIQSILILVKYKNIELSKVCISGGAILGLDFKLTATLLKTLIILQWQQIAMFTAIYTIRFILKKNFNKGLL